MTDNDEPNLVTSGKSQSYTADGLRFQIEIYRPETVSAWTLEVVDPANTSHVWEDQFASDTDAREAAIKAIESEGAVAFMRGDNVIPFRTWDFNACVCASPVFPSIDPTIEPFPCQGKQCAVA